MRLRDKVALVTGSTTGIGEAIARCFAREGARVMVHGLETAEGEQVVRAIREAGPGEADFLPGDLEAPETAADLVEKTVARFGGIHILVNNAALKTRSDLETTDAAVFDRMMAVNLRAPLLLIRACLPHFRRAGGGSVLNIGSVNGYCGERNQLAYALSKGGLMTLSRNLADAYGPEGIRVNHFNVGWVLTANEYALKVKEGLPEDWPEHVSRTFAPSGRLLSPEEIAYFALMFVADEAARINGAVVELEQYPMIGRNPAKSTD
ncbi:MAG TPA: SDR family oxidoreductase [Chthonomonadaceae bacterium]|nr:SDR family oxidoreductase [Chthonomonadaceae bacterium]